MGAYASKATYRGERGRVQQWVTCPLAYSGVAALLVLFVAQHQSTFIKLKREASPKRPMVTNFGSLFLYGHMLVGIFVMYGLQK